MATGTEVYDSEIGMWSVEESLDDRDEALAQEYEDHMASERAQAVARSVRDEVAALL